MEATMTKTDYATLTYGELKGLRDEIDGLMAAKHSEAKTKLRDEFLEKVKMFGFDVDELLGRRGKRRGTTKDSKVEAKYRDANDPSLTWTGRGRMPKWLQQRVQDGATVESFRIT